MAFVLKQFNYSHMSGVPEFPFQDICNKHYNDSAAHAVYELGVSLYTAVHKIIQRTLYLVIHGWCQI